MTACLAGGMERYLKETGQWDGKKALRIRAGCPVNLREKVGGWRAGGSISGLAVESTQWGRWEDCGACLGGWPYVLRRTGSTSDLQSVLPLHAQDATCIFAWGSGWVCGCVGALMQ